VLNRFFVTHDCDRRTDLRGTKCRVSLGCATRKSSSLTSRPRPCPCHWYVLVVVFVLVTKLLVNNLTSSNTFQRSARTRQSRGCVCFMTLSDTQILTWPSDEAGMHQAVASLGWVTPEAATEGVTPLFFPENLATFFCSSLSLSLSLFIAFTRVSPPPRWSVTFFTCTTSLFLPLEGVTRGGPPPRTP